VALADPLRAERSGAEPVRVEEALERLAHYQRLELLLAGLFRGVDYLGGAHRAAILTRRTVRRPDA
jgi:hypothetical protein